MELHSEYPEIVAELEAMRPRPRPDFAAELDARVAAGFSDSTRRAGSWFDRLGERLSDLSWRRRGGPGRRAGTDRDRRRHGGDLDLRIRPGERRSGSSPTTLRHPPRSPRARRPSDSAASLNQFSQKVAAGGRLLGDRRRAAGAAAAEHPAPTRRGPGHRDIERSARVTLAVDPDDVRSAAADVFSTVHAYDGIVLSSSVRTRGKGDAVASFDLLIPSARLDDALAASRTSGRSAPAPTPRSTSPRRRSGSRNGHRTRGEDREPAQRSSSGGWKPMPSGNRSKRSCARSAIGSPGCGPGSTPCSVAPISPGSRCGSSRTRTAPVPPGALATPPRTRHESWASPRG